MQLLPEIGTESRRFTPAGDEGLEAHLQRICDHACREVRRIVGARALEALVLGGGYGRGQGGVLRTAQGDRPYNDMEFYVFVRGQRLWHERKCRRALAGCAQRLSTEAGVHVEFKVDSIRRLQRSPITMFSYDLVARHRTVSGSADVFRDCGHHLQAERIPLAEATRLLFNRCTGLLLSKGLLQKTALKGEEADFVARNLAKAQLGLGDAVLAARGLYDWDCEKRGARMQKLIPAESMPWLQQVQNFHRVGVEFKLHPQCEPRSVGQFIAEHREVAGLALRVWLWLEARRLSCSFSSASDYAFYRGQKCPGTSAWKNLVLNIRTFGPGALLDRNAGRYPRERLFNALSLLLWNTEPVAKGPKEILHLQKQLRTDACDWSGLVTVYEQLWPQYG